MTFHRPSWFKTEISLGQVIAFGGMLIAFGWGGAELKSSLREDVQRVRNEQSVQAVRIDALEDRLARFEKQAEQLETSMSQQLGVMRAEQRAGFERLDDKLDRKADRR